MSNSLNMYGNNTVKGTQNMNDSYRFVYKTKKYNKKLR